MTMLRREIALSIGAGSTIRLCLASLCRAFSVSCLVRPLLEILGSGSFYAVLRDVCNVAHKNPVNSRATAVTTFPMGLPLCARRQ